MTSSATSRTWLTRAQVADRFDVTAHTVAGWAVQGRGPRYQRIAGRTRYLLADVEAWEDAQFVEPSRPAQDTQEAS